MTVRFASFNVENLFARPRAFNQTTWAQAVVGAEDRPSLDRFNTDLLAGRRGRRRGCAEIGRPSRRGGEPCG